MDLILWRHAEAHERDGDGEDLQRRLTAKGERQAQRVAEWLNRHLSEGTRVLVSPAERARRTADALGRQYRTIDAIGPDAHAQALLQAARWPDASGAVLIVGHQPALGDVLAQLLGGTAPWPLRKGGLVWLHRRARDGQVSLRAATSPDLL